MIIFDFETTGVDTNNDRIIQIGAKKTNLDGTIEVKNLLTNPCIPIPEGATEVHGITDEMVKDAPTFKQIAKGMSAWFSGCDLCGFNSNNFDLNILLSEFDRAGVDFEIGGDLIDVYLLYKKLYPRSLVEIYKRLLGKELENAHDALSDVNATEEVFHFLVAKHSDVIFEEKETIDLFIQGDTKRVDLAGKMYEDAEGVKWSFSKNKDKLVISDKGFANWFLGADFPKESKKIVSNLIDQ